MSQTEESVPIF